MQEPSCSSKCQVTLPSMKDSKKDPLQIQLSEPGQNPDYLGAPVDGGGRRTTV